GRRAQAGTRHEVRGGSRAAPARERGGGAPRLPRARGTVVPFRAMATAITRAAEVCAQAKRASRVLGRLDTATKDAALHEIADALLDRSDEIRAANARHLEAARAAAGRQR